MPITFSGGKSAEEFFKSLIDSAKPTEGDVIYAMAKQARRVQERTAAGMDYTEQSFVPYSDRQKYSHNPSRFLDARTQVQRQAIALHHVRYYGGKRKRGGVTVSYKSYAEFKASQGLGNVNLGGMEGSLLPAIMVNVRNQYDISAAEAIGLYDFTDPVTDGGFGIYDGKEAAIAQGHMEGQPGHLPQREFLGVNFDDMQLIEIDIMERISKRLGDLL